MSNATMINLYPQSSATIKRCQWCGDDPLSITYHDKEWGVPVHEDRMLFEFLILEGAQAGLSWLTILKKRENYRNAFEHFDYERIARYTSRDVDRLLADPGIVRNRLKLKFAGCRHILVQCRKIYYAISY